MTVLSPRLSKRIVSMLSVVMTLLQPAPVLAEPLEGKRQVAPGAEAKAASRTASAVEIQVSTGIGEGTYSAMFRDMVDVCGKATGAAFVERSGSGSIESIERLMNNEVQTAIVQADVLHARAKFINLDRIKAVMVLHPEALHLLALREPATEGGIGGLFRRNRPLQTLVDLAGRRVGAWGGAITTAQLIQAQADLRYQVTAFPGLDEAMAALNARRVDAVLAVGGAPLPWVRKLDGHFVLLTVPEHLALKLGRVYRPATLSYSNLSIQPVETVATEATFVTQDYKSAMYREPLLRLRQCLGRQIGGLRETTGRHPMWRSVDPAARSHWDRYQEDLPQPRGPAATSRAKPSNDDRSRETCEHSTQLDAAHCTIQSRTETSLQTPAEAQAVRHKATSRPISFTRI